MYPERTKVAIFSLTCKSNRHLISFCKLRKMKVITLHITGNKKLIYFQLFAYISI